MLTLPCNECAFGWRSVYSVNYNIGFGIDSLIFNDFFTFTAIWCRRLYEQRPWDLCCPFSRLHSEALEKISHLIYQFKYKTQSQMSLLREPWAMVDFAQDLRCCRTPCNWWKTFNRLGYNFVYVVLYFKTCSTTLSQKFQ